jgi:hypothetical protein
MSALSSALLAFFRGYSSPGSLHGVLRFEGEAGEGEQLSSEFRPSPTNQDSPWAELVVVDPTQAVEDVNLAPPLSPATQLLFVHELQRAASHLQTSSGQSTPIGADPKDAATGKTRQQCEALFEAVPPFKNALPAMTTEPLAALLLQGSPTKGVGSIEVAIIERIVPRPGWTAPFLHRSDTTSELHARICDINENAGTCHPRREGLVVLCPCHFVCMLELERDGGRYRFRDEDFRRFRSMRHILSKLHTHQRALGDLSSPHQQHEERQAGGSGGRRRGKRGQKKA